MQAIAQTSPLPSAPKKRQLTWVGFQKRYLTKEDGFKYEFVGGAVVKTQYAMDQTQFFIQQNLVRFFYKLRTLKPLLNGELIAEGDMFFGENHRRPDISWLTDQQIKDARHGINVTPDWVIEIISTHDQFNRMMEKMADYEKAGVKLVWHIFPKHEKVHIYQGKQMTICSGDDICSADSVVKGFEMPTSAIFA